VEATQIKQVVLHQLSLASAHGTTISVHAHHHHNAATAPQQLHVAAQVANGLLKQQVLQLLAAIHQHATPSQSQKLAKLKHNLKIHQRQDATSNRKLDAVKLQLKRTGTTKSW